MDDIPAWRIHGPLPMCASHWNIHCKHWTETVHCHCRCHCCVDMLDSEDWAIFLLEYSLFHCVGPPGEKYRAKQLKVILVRRTWTVVLNSIELVSTFSSVEMLPKGIVHYFGC